MANRLPIADRSLPIPYDWLGYWVHVVCGAIVGGGFALLYAARAFALSEAHGHPLGFWIIVQWVQVCAVNLAVWAGLKRDDLWRWAIVFSRGRQWISPGLDWRATVRGDTMEPKDFDDGRDPPVGLVAATYALSGTSMLGVGVPGMIRGGVFALALTVFGLALLVRAFVVFSRAVR